MLEAQHASVHTNCRGVVSGPWLTLDDVRLCWHELRHGRGTRSDAETHDYIASGRWLGDFWCTHRVRSGPRSKQEQTAEPCLNGSRTNIGIRRANWAGDA